MKRTCIPIAALILSIAVLFAACGKSSTKGNEASTDTERALTDLSEIAENVSAEPESVTYAQPDFPFFKTLAEVEASFPKAVFTREEAGEPVTGGYVKYYYDGDRKTEERSYFEDGNMAGSVMYDENGNVTFTYNYEYNPDGTILSYSIGENNRQTERWSYSFDTKGRLNGLTRAYYDETGVMSDMRVYGFNERGEVIAYQDLATLQQNLMAALGERLGEVLTPENLIGALTGN